MPIQIQDIHQQDDSPDCPLCMETLEVDDINFFPCECGYQICRFCWHRIRTDENGLCPACRKAYPENPAEFKPLSGQELQKIRLEKKQKEVARKQKITDSRKHLANVRVLQKNLVFVVGLSQRLADVEILKRQEYFGKYGKILKVVLNSNTSYAGTQTPSCSAYVTYSKMEESLRAIQSVNNVHIDGRTLKASLGTTKYCSNYLKNQQCMKHDCMYLHEIGEEDASFTKEDMQMAKHQEYEQKLIQQMIQKEISAAQQEMRGKTMKQEEYIENGTESAGSSPPCAASIITQGLSVAQAVKKNTKATPEATSRPRRHSSSTPTTTAVDGANSGGEAETQNAKNPGLKSTRLCTSVGDREPVGKPERGKGTSRRANTKKNSNTTTGSQAPRHKKQQQINGGKKPPSRPHSASPSTQNSQSGSDHPVSTGTSVESSPVVTPLRDVTEETYNLQSNAAALSDLTASMSSKISLRFTDEGSRNPSSDTSFSDSVERTATLPIDIPSLPDGIEDKNRDTPQSDSSSSIGRKSPFVRSNVSHENPMLDNIGSVEDITGNNQNVLTKSRFMMFHKVPDNIPTSFHSQTVTNGLGFSPFGTSNMSAPPGLHEMTLSTENGTPSPQPIGRVVPPPGLAGFPSDNTDGWPASNPELSDSIPIKSSNDWEVAFGFKSTVKETASSADDDLGFDPWAECNKGFKDLMEKELQTQDGSTVNTNNQEPPSRLHFNPMAETRSTTFHDMSASQRRPVAFPDPLRQQQPHSSQFGFNGSSSLVNGISNLLTNPPHTSTMSHQKMPFQYENQQQQQLERNRFLLAHQQRLLNHFSHNEHPERNMQHMLGSANGQKIHSSVTPSKDPSIDKEQEWQNGLRALLPSVNINFAMPTQQQRQPVSASDTSLGLSGLGMPEMHKMLNIPHPPGMPHSTNHHLFMNKPNVPPPPGVGFGARSPFSMSRQWGASESSSMSNPGLSSGRLMSPHSLQSLFASGTRSESNPAPNTVPYPPDPAIISGGAPGMGSGIRRSRLFEHPQGRSTTGINSNNNSNEEQPHWMKSLQALTELESPNNPLPSGTSTLSQLFSQRSTGVPSWPSMQLGGGGSFSNPGFGPSQPPPGFQVRPSLAKPTEFGMSHNLLENQS